MTINRKNIYFPNLASLRLCESQSEEFARTAQTFNFTHYFDKRYEEEPI